MEARAVPREAPGAGLIAPRLLRAATDARLVALVRQGQETAFEAIYDRYHRPILSFCRHLLGDPEEAADALQHTFTATYSAITGTDKSLLLRPWLFAIARNRCYSALRANREQPGLELVEPVTEDLAAQVQRREDLRQLLVDMRDLPHEQRAALVLAELGALSHTEIATALGVPSGKVKALVFQARESLIATRSARDTDCAEIRRELAVGRGAALRRTNLRRHLSHCKGCREYRRAVQRQRRALAAILPVAPAAALKDAVLGATSGVGGGTLVGVGGGTLIGGGLLASSAFKGLVLKILAGGLIALLGTAGAIGVIHALQAHGASTALADPGPRWTAPSVARARGLDPPHPRLARVAAAARAHAIPRPPRQQRLQSAGVGAAQAPAAPVVTRTASSFPAATHAGHATIRRAPAVQRTPPSAAPRRPAATAPAPRPHGRGHDRGHDRGRHLGWGQGDGGGRFHPHGK